ncbi:MAG: hypothetical protein HZB26_02355 [Candidatus Hydrogenedentes bacterium]|nr:hypothetical protein [Candidatus Hydrogenedentota bacterium]
MRHGDRRRSVLLFCFRFLVYATVCLAGLWWLILPHYAWGLGQCAGGILKYTMGKPIESLEVQAGGTLNTETLLVFYTPGKKHPIAVAALATNLATYAALVLATSGLVLGRRMKVLGLGLLILLITHVLYIVLAFYFAAYIANASEIPMALAEFFIMVPFLLWIALAYWPQLGAAIARGQKDQPSGA